MLSNEVKGEGYWGRRLRLQIQDKSCSDLIREKGYFQNLSKNVNVCNGDAAQGKEARLSFGTDIKLKIGHLVVYSVQIRENHIIRGFQEPVE